MIFPIRHPAWRCCRFLICALALAGCRESDDNADRVTPERVVADKVATDAGREIEDLPKWLMPTDKIEPAVWLRSREVGHEVLPSDPEVDRLRRAFHQAAVRFYEDPRMIANRTAQTSDMLAEAGQPERVVDIMTGMVDVADVTPFKKLYGEMCQHYLNLRKSGDVRTVALDRLSDTYRTKAVPR